MKTANLKIRALTDPDRAREAQKALEARRGVRTATVHPGDPAGVEVQYRQDGLSPELLVAGLREKGFDARIGGESVGGQT